MSNSLKNTKSTLARLLAGENISVQHKKVRTASFDVKNRVLTLPIYKKDITPSVYDTFVAHEVGHALWTPNDESIFTDRKLFPFINLVEDIRIEKRIKNKFGGLVKSFTVGYDELWKDGFFGVSEKEIPDLSFADRLNLDAKIGLDIEFNAEEEVLVKKAKSCISFTDVVEVAKEIRDYCQEEKEEKEEKQKRDKSDSTESETSEESCDSSESETSQESCDSEEEGKEEGDEESNEPNNESARLGDIGDGDDSEEGEGKHILITQENFDSAIEDKIDECACSPLYLTLPNYDLSKVTVSLDTILESVRDSRLKYHFDTTDQFAEFKRDGAPVVNHLLKQFEMKKAAAIQKKAAESKSGTLDVNRVYRYSFDDNIFKRNSTLPEGKDHGLVLFLDWSGSMHDKLTATVQQTLNLVFFCKKAGIAFDVYGFSEGAPTNTLDGDALSMGNSVLAPTGCFRLLHFISSSQSAAKFNEAAANLYWLSMNTTSSEYPLTWTPLNSAMILAPQIIDEFKKKTGAQVVHTVLLTDGLASDNSLRYTRLGSYNGFSEKSFSPDTFIVYKNKNYPSSVYINNYRTASETIALLEMVKEISGTTITGFFLTPESASRVAYIALSGYKPHEHDWAKKKELADMFKKDKSITFTDCGFDELHFISSNRKYLSTIGEDFFAGETKGDVKAAVKEVKNALGKIGKEKNKRRVVLNRFVELISKPKTIV